MQAQAEPGDDRPLRVLVVDDIAVNRELMQIVLEREGCRVDVAASGPAAVALAAGERFDLVLLDLQMPGMDGFETARALRRPGSASAGAFVVAVTALGSPEVIERCQAEGMSGRLLKPVSPDNLVAMVRSRPGGALPTSSPPRADPLQAGLALLEARFRADLAGYETQLAGLCAAADVEGWSEAGRRRASNLAHLLAGCSGLFGLDELGRAARAGEQALLDPVADPTAPMRALQAALGSARAEPG